MYIYIYIYHCIYDIITPGGQDSGPAGPGLLGLQQADGGVLLRGAS